MLQILMNVWRKVILVSISASIQMDPMFVTVMKVMH